MSSSIELETTTRAAQRARVSPRTLLRWLRAGLLRGIQTAGGHWRVALTDVEAFLAEQSKATTPSSRRARPSVVVVEDQPEHAAALERLLRLLLPDPDVRCVTDGLEAALIIGALRPHLLFVDLELPGIDGVELIRRALMQPALREMRIVVISGHLTPERVAVLTELGIEDLFSKPLDPTRLRRCLAMCHEGAAATTPTTSDTPPRPGAP